MAWRGEGGRAGCVLHTSLQEDDGGLWPGSVPPRAQSGVAVPHCGPGGEHSSSGRSWSGGHMPLLTSGGGLATGTDVSCPERQMEEAHAKGPNFRGISSVVGIRAVFVIG